MSTIAFIQPKGGVGASTVATATAVLAARYGDVLIVDPADTGDHGAILGTLPVDDGDGVFRTTTNVWVTADPDAAVRHAERFATVIIDAGSTPDDAVVASAKTVVLVTDATYLSLRRAAPLVTRYSPDRVVAIVDPALPLTPADVAAVLGTPQIVVPRHPSIARAVDAGLFAFRLPDKLARPLGADLAAT